MSLLTGTARQRMCRRAKIALLAMTDNFLLEQEIRVRYLRHGDRL